MEVATRICFIERSVQFEEDQLHDTPPAAQEGITISPPIFYDDDVLQVQIHMKKITFNMILLLILNIKKF